MVFLNEKTRGKRRKKGRLIMKKIIIRELQVKQRGEIRGEIRGEEDRRRRQE